MPQLWQYKTSRTQEETGNQAVFLCYYSAFRLDSNKSMHSSALQGTDCINRSLARGCLGFALQLQGSTSRDRGRLNCYIPVPSFRAVYRKISVLIDICYLSFCFTVFKCLFKCDICSVKREFFFINRHFQEAEFFI